MILVGNLKVELDFKVLAPTSIYRFVVLSVFSCSTYSCQENNYLPTRILNPRSWSHF